VGQRRDVTAQDVLFFMNIYHAEPANFCGYVKGDFPDNVTNVTASGQTVTFTFNKAYNHFWILYNELGPDHAAAHRLGHHGRPGALPVRVAAPVPPTAQPTPPAPRCTPSWPTPPLSTRTIRARPTTRCPPTPRTLFLAGRRWPVEVEGVQPDGETPWSPTPPTSGPVKPTLKSFTELPYTSTSAEFTPWWGQPERGVRRPRVTCPQGTTTRTSPGRTTPRLTGTYDLNPLYTFSINYFPENFDSNANGGVTGKLFNQLYIRQPSRTWSTSPSTSRRSGRATPCRHMGRSPWCRPTRMPPNWRRAIPTRTVRARPRHYWRTTDGKWCQRDRTPASRRDGQGRLWRRDPGRHAVEVQRAVLVRYCDPDRRRTRR